MAKVLVPRAAGEETLTDLRPVGLIQPIRPTEETSHERLMRKHLPAWVASGAVHVVLVATLIGVDLLFPAPRDTTPPSTEQVVVDAPIEPEQEISSFTNPSEGIIAEVRPGALPDPVMEPSDSPPEDLTSQSPVDNSALQPSADDKLISGLAGNFDSKSDRSGVVDSSAFRGRNDRFRDELNSLEGGDDKTAAAVARGLIWLAAQQRSNGAWVFDGDERTKQDVVASTSLALLPFLAAGHTHKVSKNNAYKLTVDRGLRFLLNQQMIRPGDPEDGSFVGGSVATRVYSHAIATVALCEALGMSGDTSLLKNRAQRAVNRILRTQQANGGWGYDMKMAPDTSIVGWQIQALHAAKLCRELSVDAARLQKAREFLDTVAVGSDREKYGYRDKSSPTACLTAIGLLARYYGDGWNDETPGFRKGVDYLVREAMPDRKRMDIYYLYYASQVVHYRGGTDWTARWNPAMKTLLLETQIPPGAEANSGSWDPDLREVGSHCGRLGQTVFSTLCLQTYYRYVPSRPTRPDNSNLK